MKTFSVIAMLGLCLGLSGSLVAQCPNPVMPGTETFDSLTPANAASGLPIAPATPVPLPAGWSHDIGPSALNVWQVGGSTPPTDGTPSGGTGPSADHTGGGSFLYTETSGTTLGDQATIKVCFLGVGVQNPFLTFWYHMFGTEMGTLAIEQSLDGGLTYPITLFTQTGDQGDVWLSSDIPITLDINLELNIRIVGTSGGHFRSDMSIDDVAFGGAIYETNDGDGALTIDDQSGTLLAPVVIQKPTTPCGGTPGTLKLATDNAGSLWEIAFNNSNLVGSVVPINGSILNLDPFGGFSFLNGGGLPVFAPMAGGGFPGAGSSSWSLGFTITTPTDLSLQAVVTTPVAPPGFVFTGATELHAQPGTISSFPGPALDDGSLVVDLLSGGTCYSSSGFTFNGTVYQNLSVEANGRVMFGTPDGDFNSSISEALTDAPFLGFWCDLTPNNSIVVSNPNPGVFRVDYFGATYFANPGQTVTALSYAIEIDDTNQIFTLDGLLGIAPNAQNADSGDDQFLGLSVGGVGGATDGGPITFTMGGAGATANATDMVYDFYDHSASPTPAGLGLSLVPGTLNRIEMSPAGGTWIWQGF